MGHITQEHLQQSTIAIPDDIYIANLFESKVAPIFDKKIKLQEERQQFTKLRDELLPLLMNGQVSVNYDLSLLSYCLFLLLWEKQLSDKVMKKRIIAEILAGVSIDLEKSQIANLQSVLERAFEQI